MSIFQSKIPTKKDSRKDFGLISLNDFIGQERVKNKLRELIKNSSENHLPFPHLILCGENGIGKRTISQIISNEINCGISFKSANYEINRGDLVGLFTNLKGGDFIFFEDIDLLKKSVIDLILPVICNYSVDIVIGKGPSARSVKLKLPNFSFIGSLENINFLDNRFRTNCGVIEFDLYSEEEIEKIINSFISKYGTIDQEAVDLLAHSCELNPGKSKLIIEWIMKYTDALSNNHVTRENVKKANSFLGLQNNLEQHEKIEKEIENLNGLEFEEFVASIFTEKGYVVSRTKASGDHGIDLIINNGEDKIAVQCKKWNKPIGESIVRDFYGALLKSKITKGLIISTNKFTQSAYKFAHKTPIELINITQLVKSFS